MNEIVRVPLGARGYDIHIGSGLIDRAGTLIAPLLGASGAVVVTDESVASLHLDRLSASLDQAGIAHRTIVLPPGEASKGLETLGRLLDDLLGAGLERSTAVIAFGGGVIGDLAGFAAAVALRGIPFIQVPTTLLAQVDSALGGKTGINSRHGKNLIGAFHQPRLVVSDVDLLDSLPVRQRRAGYAEVVKYGLIDRPDFFTWLEQEGAALLAGDSERLIRAIRTSCEAKAAIVAADEREAGARALLNLGHTFGHALEAETGFGDTLLHGEAVAIGMVMAFDLSVRLGLCPAADADRVRRHLAAVGLPVAPPRECRRPDALMAHMARDKKVADGRITFVLARGIGKAFVARDIDAAAAAAILAEAAAA
ncbi:MAG: 3-dehydroquinate synthase [Inquilinus sp.]|nr:3-dehydroquinate synthase [Inquilinus sp.]